MKGLRRVHTAMVLDARDLAEQYPFPVRDTGRRWMDGTPVMERVDNPARPGRTVWMTQAEIDEVKEWPALAKHDYQPEEFRFWRGLVVALLCSAALTLLVAWLLGWA